MQIEKKRVRCPHCGVVLDVQNKGNERVRQFACPRCKTMLRVDFTPQEELATQLAAPRSVAKRLCLTYAGQEYALHDGRNIVGRKAATSSATVQIDTPDKTMSRQHAVIAVCPIANGERKVVLCDYQSKNGIYVNGQQLREGDEIRLADGNRIKMGDTTLIFRVKK